jgi:hypothetical protein
MPNLPRQYSDFEIKNALREAMASESFLLSVRDSALAGAEDLIREKVKEKRRIAYRRLKEAYTQDVAGLSGMPPGYKYSFSGSDANAWVYYPNKAMKFISEREKLLFRLKMLEAERNNGAVGVDDAIAAIQDGILGLPNTTNAGWVQLQSLSTISVNIHEPRSQVRSLGFKGIRGFAGSVRTIAGTMIFTIVEGHPLRELMMMDDEVGDRPSHRSPWSVDNYVTGRGTQTNHFDSYAKVSTMLTPFNLVLQYVSEYQPQNRLLESSVAAGSLYACMEIEGIQLISQGLVTSVNDIVTEIQYQFMAEDIKEFAGFDYVRMVDQFAFDEAKIQSSPQDELLRELDIDPESTSLKYYEEKLGGPMSELINTQLAMRLSETLGSDLTYSEIVQARQDL